MQWVAGVVTTYGFSHSEIMRMPFRTFLAYNRMALVENVNSSLEKKFAQALGR